METTTTAVIPANLVMSHNLRSSEMVHSRQERNPVLIDGFNTMRTCKEQEVKILWATNKI